AADEQVKKILAGDIKFSGKAKATKLSGAVNTEAMRIARIRVKDAIKAAGMKISLVKASDITAAAKELVAQDATIVAEAEANGKARETGTIAVPTGFDIKSLVHEDAGLKAKADAEKAEKDASKPLSAKQAGQVKGRKPKAKPAADAGASA